jgi:hypothetical protein
VQVVFMDALETEGLLELVEARQDAPPPDPLSLDADVDVLPPVLLAVSDNGPQMTSTDTRAFMAMCAIAQHFGRPTLLVLSRRGGTAGSIACFSFPWSWVSTSLPRLPAGADHAADSLVSAL